MTFHGTGSSLQASHDQGAAPSDVWRNAASLPGVASDGTTQARVHLQKHIKRKQSVGSGREICSWLLSLTLCTICPGSRVSDGVGRAECLTASVEQSVCDGVGRAECLTASVEQSDGVEQSVCDGSGLEQSVCDGVGRAEVCDGVGRAECLTASVEQSVCDGVVEQSVCDGVGRAECLTASVRAECL
ncbi:unnamed protein product [Boreogadus saida]